VFALVLLLVLVAIVVIISVAIITVQGRLERHSLGGLTFGVRECCGFAFRGLALAHFPVIFPGIENQMQPRHHLLDRGQLAGRSGFAAGACRTLRAGFTLRASLAALALRSGFTLRAGLAVRARLAARAFQAGRSGMPLRPGTSGFAARTLWSLSSLPGTCFVRHVHAPNMIPKGFLSDV
jgi:hypothetical protein